MFRIIFVDVVEFSWIWLNFRRIFVDLVVFSLNLRGCFVDLVEFSLIFAWIWWIFLWISLNFRRFGGILVEFSLIWWNFRETEILKLKELPNERLEGSWRALWLGIRTLFGFKLGVVGLQGGGKLLLTAIP